MIRHSDGYSLQARRVVRVSAVKHTLKLSRVKVLRHPGWLRPPPPPSGGLLDIKSHFKPLCMPGYVYFSWGGGKRAACVSLYFGQCDVVLLEPSRGRQLRHKTHNNGTSVKVFCYVHFSGLFFSNSSCSYGATMSAVL